MANCCGDSCIEVLQRYGGMSRINAVHHMMKMRVQDRWQLDVWGTAKQFMSESDDLGASHKLIVESDKVWSEERFSSSLS